MTGSKLCLTSGREISQVSSFARNLAVDLSAGLAADILEQYAMATAERIWPGEAYSLLKGSLHTHGPQLSTQFLCMGEFISHTPLPDSEEIASSLVVIWFQTVLTPECEQEALQELRSIDWNLEARGFSW